jgi:hypothetical protein
MSSGIGIELCRRVARYQADDLLKVMGYGAPTQKSRRRLKNVVENPDLGLGSGNFDFKYSDQAFLKALGVVLGLDQRALTEHMAAIIAEQDEEKKAFRPYVWVDTDFQRTSQPVFALAACESQRYLRFGRDFWRLPLHDQLLRARRRIRSHIRGTAGELGIWGAIQRYWFFHKEEQALLLSRDGRVIGERHGPVPSRSKLSPSVEEIIS